MAGRGVAWTQTDLPPNDTSLLTRHRGAQRREARAGAGLRHGISAWPGACARDMARLTARAAQVTLDAWGLPAVPDEVAARPTPHAAPPTPHAA